MTLDLSKYYPPDVAEDIERRLIGKIIIATKVRNKNAVRKYLLNLQVEMAKDRTLGLDWFDFAYLEIRAGKIMMEFYKYNPDKTKNIMPIGLDESDMKSNHLSNILSIIRSTKDRVKGTWWE
jgi:hypothetical protein